MSRNRVATDVNAWPSPVQHLVIPLRGYLNRADNARKNSAGVAMRSDVRRATAFVKCLGLWVRSQSGLLAMVDRSTGTSAAWRIKCRLDRTRSAFGEGTSSGLVSLMRRR